MARDISGNHEANYLRQNAGTRCKSWCVPAVNTVPCGGLIESLWDLSCGKGHSELVAEPSLVPSLTEVWAWHPQNHHHREQGWLSG